MDLPITMTGTRPLFAAKVNDVDVRFILDTGAFWSMISPAAAQQLNLKTHAAPYGLTVKGIGGTTTPTVASVTFNLAGTSIPHVEFLVGGSEVGSGTIGLLGENFLEYWDVEYDFANGKVRLMKDVDCRQSMLAYWVTPGQPYSTMDIYKTTLTEPFIGGSAYINGVKIHVMFDTGAATSILSLRAAARAGVKLDSPGVVDLGFAWGIGRGMIKSYGARFASFKIGDDGEEIKNAQLRLADIEFGSMDMLIGSDFFLSHRIFVANSQHKLYFTYNGGPVFNLSASPPTQAAADAAANASQETKPEDSKDQKAGEESTDAAALARRGSASAGRHDFDHALTDLNRAVELDPQNPDYLYQRARVYWEKRDRAAAMADFDRVLALQPNHVLALMGRAQFRIADRNFPGAKADLDTVDGIVPKQDNVRLELAHAYQAADLLPSAIAQFDLWIQSHGEDVQLSGALNGRCWSRALQGKDLAAALADCNKAERLTANGADAAILDSRGLVRLRLGDYVKAIADYDASLKLRPKNAWSLYGRGVAKIRSNHASEGEADIAEAVKYAPSIAERFKALGVVPRPN